MEEGVREVDERECGVEMSEARKKGGLSKCPLFLILVHSRSSARKTDQFPYLSSVRFSLVFEGCVIWCYSGHDSFVL